MLYIQQTAITLATGQKGSIPSDPILLGSEHQAHHNVQVLVLLTTLRMSPIIKVISLILCIRHREDKHIFHN